MSSLRALLRGLIDYAGLFPPASLGMEAMVRNFAAGQVSEHAWALGRIIVPAARLPEFAEACTRLPAYREMRISVLADAADRELIERFNAEHAADGLMIDAAESKVTSTEQVRATALALGGMDLYFEIAPAQQEMLLPTVIEAGARAKLRTGGITPELIPSADAVFGFLEAAHRAGVAFKATAGLHHPLRSRRALTYEPDCASATMHGFINVFFAAAALHAGMRTDDARNILAETDPAAFRFTDDAAHWRNRVSLTLDQIRDARERFVLSFGSCSFAEPIADLKELGWL